MTGAAHRDDTTFLVGWGDRTHDQPIPVEDVPAVGPWPRWAARAIIAATSVSVVHLLVSALSILVARPLALYGLGLDTRLAATHLPQYLVLTREGGISVYLDELPFDVRLLGAIPGLLLATSVLLCGVFVVQILWAVVRGDAFREDVQVSLSRLGTAAVVGGGLVGVADLVAARRALSGAFEADGVISLTGLQVAGPAWPWWMIAVGLVALALQVVFREGARLRWQVAGVV